VRTAQCRVYSSDCLLDLALARIFHELLSRDHEDGRATGKPQGVGSEAYLNGTSQGPRPEDAWKDGHIIRDPCAPLSPASGFPVSWLQQAIHEISGLGEIQSPFFQSGYATLKVEGVGYPHLV